MKKLIIAACMAFIGAGTAFAQQGKQAVGGSFSYGTEVGSLAVGAKYQYYVTNEIRLEPSIDYFFENDGLDMFDINANVHYLFPVATNVTVYPLAGFTFTRWHQDLDLNIGGIGDLSASASRFGVNLGAGVELALDKNWSMNFELKYQLISDLDQAVFNIGVAYSF